MPKKRKKKSMKSVNVVPILKVTDKTLKKYTNIAVVRNTEHDFIIDFCFNEPPSIDELETIQIEGKHTIPIDIRLVMSPSFVPRLLNAIQTQWDRYAKTKRYIKKKEGR